MSCVKYEDFNLICRLCLRKVAALTRFGDLPKNQNLSFIETILEVHLNFKISVVDDKPQNICKGCILQLFKTCHFLQMCIKSNNSLDEALEQENIGGTEPVDHAVSDPLDNSNQENFASDSNKLCEDNETCTEDNETCTVPFVKVEGGSETSINRNEWNSGDLLEIVKNDVSSFDDDNVPIKIEDYEDEPSGLSSSANAPFEQPDISDEHNIPSFKKRSFTNTINDKSRSIKKNVNSKKRPSKNLQSTVKKKSIETLNNDDIVNVLKMNWGQKQGDWTSEQDSILINFVKTYECLYNVQCKDYRKTELKQNLWNEIGGILDKTGIDCYKRWSYLRDYYIRRKRKPSSSTGDAARKRSKQLSFLDGLTLEKTNTTGNVEGHENKGDLHSQDGTDTTRSQEYQVLNKNDINQAIHRSESSSDADFLKSTLLLKSKYTTLKSTDSEKCMCLWRQIAERQQHHAAASLEDANDLFFAAMAKIVKKLPDLLQAKIRLQIGTFVEKAEIHHLSRSKSR